MKNPFVAYIALFIAAIPIFLPADLQTTQVDAIAALAKNQKEKSSIEKLESSLRSFFSTLYGAGREVGRFALWTGRQGMDFSSWWMGHFEKHPQVTATVTAIAAAPIVLPVLYRIYQYNDIKETLDEARVFCRDIIKDQNGGTIPDGEPATKHYTIFSKRHLPSAVNDTVYSGGKKETTTSRRQDLLNYSNYAEVVVTCKMLLAKLAKYSYVQEYFGEPDSPTNDLNILTNPLNYDPARWVLDHSFNAVLQRFNISTRASGWPQYHGWTSIPSVWLSRFWVMGNNHCVVSSSRSIEQLILEPYAGEATRLYIFIQLIQNWLEMTFEHKRDYFTDMRRTQLDSIRRNDSESDDD